MLDKRYIDSLNFYFYGEIKCRYGIFKPLTENDVKLRSIVIYSKGNLAITDREWCEC